MSETTTLTEEKKPETPIGKNPFDESSWDSATTEVKDTTTVQSKEPGAEAVSPEVVDEDVFLNTYFQREFGSDPAAAKAEWETLRKLKDEAQTPAEIKFANDQSKQFFDLLKEGKIDDVYGYLHQQKQLERLEKLELAKVEDAAEIIKANLQFKHKDLTAKEIEFLFNKRYSIPKQPSQSLDETDDDYAQRIESWKSDVQEKEQEMIIEAKLAKPEFAKYKSELILPDIQKAVPVQAEPDQESLEALAAGRNKFLTQLEAGYKNFNGFETKVKDESVEIPITFNVPDEEKVAYFNKLKEFNINSYFDARWFDKDGNANVPQMMSDLYMLDNPGKVFQGMANNSASKRLDEYLKAKSNIKIDGTPQGTFVPDSKDAKQKEADTIWDA
jgi:hypothetical protein